MTFDDLLIKCAHSKAFVKYFNELLQNDGEYLDESIEDKKLKTYICVFGGNEVGTVEATDEDDAYRKMEKAFPELPYGEYDGVAEVFPLKEEV